MLLDGSTLDLSDVEAKIRSFLAFAVDVDANAQRACAQFEIVLASVLRLLAGNRSTRYWQLDDFWCDSVVRSGDVVTLSGVPYWLSGGDGCDRFRLDVALGQEPLLYSYKFTKAATDEQLLYIGKTPDGWVVTGH
jgi:hypothetical protein